LDEFRRKSDLLIYSLKLYKDDPGMLPDYEIVIGRGIGLILFGMTKGELVDLLGEPNETYRPEEESKAGWETYGYDSIKCSFSFDPVYEDKLVEISVENGYFHIFHKIRVGLTKDELIRQGVMFKLGNHVSEELNSEETPGRELISYEKFGLNFYLDEGIVTLIQVSALLNPDRSVSWPEEPTGQ
jgi:hypothetical protein